MHEPASPFPAHIQRVRFAKRFRETTLEGWDNFLEDNFFLESKKGVAIASRAPLATPLLIV